MTTRPTMRAWQMAAPSPIEQGLVLVDNAPRPGDPLLPDGILVRVIAAGLNPVDYKTLEAPLTRVARSWPAIPGRDFCGEVIKAGLKVDTVREGSLVFGSVPVMAKNGSLGEYLVAEASSCVSLPDGVTPDQAVAIGVPGRTAWYALEGARVGDRVFINGGSGGTGSWAIQLAKNKGLRVTTTCSTANVELCKSLGADDVIDYRKEDVLAELAKRGQVFKICIDNAGAPENLYQASHTFLLPDKQGSYVQVAGTAKDLPKFALNYIRPSFLGGGQAPYRFLRIPDEPQVFIDLANMIKDGSVHPLVDSTFEYEQAQEAFAKLKTGRARGKIVLHVARQ